MNTRLAFMVVVGALLLPGSGDAQTGLPPGPPMGRGQQRFAGNITEVLGLTERQFSELNDLRHSHNEKLRELGEQMRELEQQRREAMSAGDNPALVGSIAFQLQEIQRQVEDENKAYHEQALMILDGGQREKVEKIQEALKLAPSAGALMQFGLLDTSDLPGGRARGVFLGGPAGRMMRGPDAARGAAPPPGP